MISLFDASRSSVFLALLLALGCGSGDPKTGIVSGRVTLDGQELTTGSIRFVPLDGHSPTAGAQITNGIYSAEVAVGETRVEITSPRPKNRKGPAKPNSAEELEEAVPPRFNSRSELKFNVISGKNNKDFELAGK
ncbi:hypothetical protein [Zavarzinella formosa]|uniref:hypothetical protein n=1 Tax=Zavarzinella formosa TaxID=360055 RepID=UPI0002D79AC4|nr:hypothetical protein [Zavarzinella formosa]